MAEILPIWGKTRYNQSIYNDNEQTPRLLEAELRDKYSVSDLKHAVISPEMIKLISQKYIKVQMHHTRGILMH